MLAIKIDSLDHEAFVWYRTECAFGILFVIATHRKTHRFSGRSARNSAISFRRLKISLHKAASTPKRAFKGA